jgi:hypothetical protein
VVLAKGVVRAVAVTAALVLSLFLAIGGAAEPAPATGRGAGKTAARAESEQPHCRVRRHGSDGIRVVLPGSVSVPAPAPAPRGTTGSDQPAAAEDAAAPGAVTAPRTARQAVPLTRSGELPVALSAFRC